MDDFLLQRDLDNFLFFCTTSKDIKNKHMNFEKCVPIMKSNWILWFLFNYQNIEIFGSDHRIMRIFL